MLLHTLNATPGQHATEQCLRCVTSDDALLLLGDGVYAAASAELEVMLASTANLYVLADDARAAGVNIDDERITLIDMAGFVTLTEQYERSLAWY